MMKNLPSLRHALYGVLLALSVGAAEPALASPLVDLLAGDVLPMTEQLKPDLHLTPNQQTLWHQTEQKTRAILSGRQQRRARLQEKTEQILHAPGAELRDLAPAYDEDGAAAEQEARQLRELWLNMADALDDKQRKLVQDFILDRMQRVADGPGRGDSGSSSGRGGRGSRPSGGMGGMGGAGGGMGGMGGTGSSGGSFNSDTGF